MSSSSAVLLGFNLFSKPLEIWILDVTSREDDTRVRKDHAPENMAMVRHIILNMLQNTRKKFKDMSIKRLQKKAGWGDSTLDMILIADF